MLPARRLHSPIWQPTSTWFAGRSAESAAFRNSAESALAKRSGDGLRPVLGGIGALIHFADEADCRRVNVHWPSSIGLGANLAVGHIPSRDEWQDLVLMVTKRTETRPDFFMEIERGFLAEGDPLVGCALEDFSNLQIMPDGRAYRCGLLVDQEGMASLTMTGDQLRLTRPGFGEELLRPSTPPGCSACPAVQADGRRACIYDKVSSAPSG